MNNYEISAKHKIQELSTDWKNNKQEIFNILENTINKSFPLIMKDYNQDSSYEFLTEMSKTLSLHNASISLEHEYVYATNSLGTRLAQFETGRHITIKEN